MQCASGRAAAPRSSCTVTPAAWCRQQRRRSRCRTAGAAEQRAGPQPAGVAVASQQPPRDWLDVDKPLLWQVRQAAGCMCLQLGRTRGCPRRRCSRRWRRPAGHGGGCAAAGLAARPAAAALEGAACTVDCSCVGWRVTQRWCQHSCGGATPPRLSALQMLLLSDGSVTRHLQLLTGAPITVVSSLMLAVQQLTAPLRQSMCTHVRARLVCCRTACKWSSCRRRSCTSRPARHWRYLGPWCSGR